MADGLAAAVPAAKMISTSEATAAHAAKLAALEERFAAEYAEIEGQWGNGDEVARKFVVKQREKLESQVLLSYLEGKSYQEMARELNRHVKSIDNALQRVKRKIEKTLGEEHY